MIKGQVVYVIGMCIIATTVIVSSLYIYDDQPSYKVLGVYRNAKGSCPEIKGNIMRVASDYGVEPKYIIITPEEWEPKAETLAQWKTEKGIPTDVYTIEFIQNNVFGSDLGEKIHNFLEIQWQQNPELRYILLFGDHEIIPARYIYTGCGPYGQSNFIYSDHYYAALESSWDKDGDGIYGESGEEDVTPDVIVGRLPVSNVGEAQRIVERIIMYETSPPEGDWINKGLIVGGLMYAPNAEDYDPESDNAYKVQKKVVPKLNRYFDLTELYDYPCDVGGQYVPEWLPGTTDNLNPEAFKSAFNQGCAIVNAVTQGYMSGNGLGDYADDGYTFDQNSYSHYLFSYEDALTSTNGYKLPFVYISSCSVGNFTEFDDTNLETLLTATSGGAIGLIAGVDLTYRGETASGSYGNWWLNERFWEIFVNDTQIAGEVYYRMKMDYYKERYLATIPVPKELIASNIYGYHLLADPTLLVWRGEYTNANLVTPAVVYNGQHTYTFVIEDPSGNRINNTFLLCIRAQNFYKSIDIPINGKVNIDIPDGITWVNITITGQGILPIRAQLNVESAPPDIELKSIDAPATALKGEEYTVNLKLYNPSIKDTSKFSIGIYKDSINDTNLIKTIGDVILSAGENKTLEVTLMATSHGTQRIYVLADYLDTITELDETNNYGYFDIQILAPDISISNNDLSIIGYVVYGESVNITFVLHNKGDYLATNVYILLRDAPPYMGGTIITQLGPYDIPVKGNINDTVVIPNINNKMTVYFIADPEDMINEIDESNNIANITLEPNKPPEIAYIPTIYSDEDTPIYSGIDLSLYCTDEDGPDTLNYSIKSVIGNVTAKINGTAIDIIPAKDWFGNATIVVGVSDGISEMGAIIHVVINNINDPPIIKTPEDGARYSVGVGDTLYINVSAIDIDGDTLIFKDDSNILNIDKRTGRIVYTPTESDLGDHSIKISVSDGNTEVFITIHIKVYSTNHPPEIEPVGTLTAYVGKKFEYQIIAKDADGDTLTYNIESDIATIDTTTGLITIIPSEKDIGTHTIAVYVSDGKDTARINILVYVEKGDEKGNNLMAIEGNPTVIYTAVALSITVSIIIFVVFYMKAKGLGPFGKHQ